MIYCLLVTGIPLNDITRNLLFNTAQEMFACKIERKDVQCEWCEGYILTEWKTKSIGYVYGKEFTAVLETDLGKVEVNFLVKESGIRAEDGEWVSLPQHTSLPTFSDN